MKMFQFLIDEHREWYRISSLKLRPILCAHEVSFSSLNDNAPKKDYSALKLACNLANDAVNELVVNANKTSKN